MGAASSHRESHAFYLVFRWCGPLLAEPCLVGEVNSKPPHAAERIAGRLSDNSKTPHAERIAGRLSDNSKSRHC